MTLLIVNHPFAYDMECLVRLFYPGDKLTVSDLPQAEDDNLLITGLRREGENLVVWASVKTGGATLSDEERFVRKDQDWEWDAKRRMGVLLFGLLCRVTGQRPPWGILTGVRPVRLYGKLLSRLGTERAVFDALVRDYLVLPQKAALAQATLRTQKTTPDASVADSYSLYVSIPFCPTRCLYCSFVSHAIDKAAKLLPNYLRLLSEELSYIGALAGRLGLKLRTVYIGGGTPTILEPEQLRVLFSQIEKSFDFSGCFEYTVEAGRPDSISQEKLAVLKNFGVSRISVNPQTMDDTILEAIGRAHTSAQIVESVALARSMGFNNINMDLIAGLPGQTPRSFSHTLDRILEIRPQNITVHTLTIKRSSTLRARSDAFDQGSDSLGELLELSQMRLMESGYMPYYLYRQQSTRQNLENTGFSLPGSEGLYNIYSMEDAQTIFAAGAGGVTKLCDPYGRIKRVFNYKYPYEYISGFEAMIERKDVMERFYTRL